MRQTGQTFRSVLGALKLASEGKRVVYECRTHEMARWTFDKAARITADFMELEIPEKLVLKIGNGTVRFVARLNERELHQIEHSEKYELVTDS